MSLVRLLKFNVLLQHLLVISSIDNVRLREGPLDVLNFCYTMPTYCLSSSYFSSLLGGSNNADSDAPLKDFFRMPLLGAGLTSSFKKLLPNGPIEE